MLAAREGRREDLGAVVDQAVAVDVERQDAILAHGPGHLVEQPVGIDVERDAIVKAGKFEARVAEVEDERVNARRQHKVAVTERPECHPVDRHDQFDAELTCRKVA